MFISRAPEGFFLWGATEDFSGGAKKIFAGEPNVVKFHLPTQN